MRIQPVKKRNEPEKREIIPVIAMLSRYNDSAADRFNF
jgi:hypothetical protein